MNKLSLDTWMLNFIVIDDQTVAQIILEMLKEFDLILTQYLLLKPEGISSKSTEYFMIWSNIFNVNFKKNI